MNTPIFDFVRSYAEKNTARFHMPGHKGKGFIGCEQFDITEIKGADELFSANGIIAESEKNAASLFGTAKTLYSTEGSSLCIRAMIYLAATESTEKRRKYILAARNVHKAFIYALALCDVDVVWISGKTDSVCSCDITADDVENALKTKEYPPIAVYVTSPDYLGRRLPINEIADVCHKRGTRLLVDNAHGAYLHFLPERSHPMDLGADMCCDSAHKTLPSLTGGAYLHVSTAAPEYYSENAKNAMAFFGSTSPSYLILSSLDLCNRYLSDNFCEKLKIRAEEVERTKEALKENGWSVLPSEPMKITILAPEGKSGTELADLLRNVGFECEYADEEYLVIMISTETDERELFSLVHAIGTNILPLRREKTLNMSPSPMAMTVRNALFSQSETIPVSFAQGKVCASPTVSCPPAIPIAVSGEIIGKEQVAVFRHYGIEKVSVVKEK